MPPLVCMGATLMCTFGAAPSALVVPPASRVMGPTPVATIMDNVPFMNIPPFGMCTSMANPQVAAATAAAFGVLTPMPCMPVIPAPWSPGSPTVTVGGKPALQSTSILTCAFAGVITISNPGQATAMVP